MVRFASLFIGIAAICTFAGAQFTSENVKLNAHLDLATLGASAGNDCWGYVSPSGREYAIISLRNRCAFVEITDPDNPVFFAVIPHLSSTWGDVKVYQGYAYAVTEASGSGLQVIDMTQIDDHIVTLVKTIDSPGRSHNVVIDTDSGYLYTVGSRNGTGTTMCFDLSDPANPVQVGKDSMTTHYQHDVQAVTYFDGPYAGREILFGSGEGRGLEIWDVTDKNNPFLVSRTVHDMVGYTHQGWLCEERKYFYVNDELDENNFNIPTRTLIYDVSDIDAPIWIGSFTTGLPAIDHNLYYHKGFIFQANYRSGLRIFSAVDDKEAPVEVGWFNTYPANNNQGFDGAWSNYPFFPSGTVIVSDINRGLFILDAREATIRKNEIVSAEVIFGEGNLQVEKLGVPNGDTTSLTNDRLGSRTSPGVQIVFEGPSQWVDPSWVGLSLTGWASLSNLKWSVELYNWDTETWVEAYQSLVPTGTEWTMATTRDHERFVRDSDLVVRARLTVTTNGPIASSSWSLILDEVRIAANP